MSTVILIVMQVLLLGVCEFWTDLSPFVARKLVHSFSGLMMLYLDPVDWLARYFVYAVVVSSLMMVWEVGAPFKFRYSNSRDVGITVYLIIVGLFYYTQTSLWIIKPVFFADPCGAIVGKWLTKNKYYNPKWNGEKTVGGTIAVFIAAFLSISYGGMLERLVLAVIVAVAEGLSKDYDNLLIAAVVMVYYMLIGQKSGGISGGGSADYKLQGGMHSYFTSSLGL